MTRKRENIRIFLICSDRKLNMIAIILSLFFCVFIFAGNTDALPIDTEYNLSVSERYDDNVNYAENDAKKDFITTVSFSTSVSYYSKKRDLSGELVLEQDVLARYLQFNDHYQHLKLSYNEYINSRSSLNIEESFSHSEEVKDYSEGFGRINRRAGYFENNIYATYKYEISRLLEYEVVVGEDIENSSEEGVLDSFMHTFSSGIKWNLSSYTFFEFFYSFFMRYYNPGDRIEKQNVKLSLKHYFTETLYLKIGAGENVLNDDDISLSPYFTASFGGTLAKRADVYFSFLLDDKINQYVDDRFRAREFLISVDTMITPKVDLFTRFFYGDGHYLNTDRRDYVFGSDVALSYRLYENLSLRLSYSFTSVDSNVDNASFKKNVTSLSLNYKF